VRRLLILRHAKSSWKEEGLVDHDRQLNKRGMCDAPRMGQLLVTEGIVPDLIISSTARRAHDTVELLTEACAYEGDVVWASSLYMGGYRAYLNTLRNADDEFNTVMIVGHNPDSEQLLTVLTGVNETMPTAALAQIDLPLSSWRELEEGQSYPLIALWRPRELKS
jgi:phosphohistidine phosphatase